MNLKLTVRLKISETCRGASMTKRRVTSLELRRVVWLKNPIVFRLGGGTISFSFWIYMD